MGVAHTWPHSFLQTITKQTPEEHGFYTQKAFYTPAGAEGAGIRPGSAPQSSHYKPQTVSAAQ